MGITDLSVLACLSVPPGGHTLFLTDPRKCFVWKPELKDTQKPLCLSMVNDATWNDWISNLHKIVQQYRNEWLPAILFFSFFALYMALCSLLRPAEWDLPGLSLLLLFVTLVLPGILLLLVTLAARPILVRLNEGLDKEIHALCRELSATSGVRVEYRTAWTRLENKPLTAKTCRLVAFLPENSVPGPQAIPALGESQAATVLWASVAGQIATPPRRSGSLTMPGGPGSGSAKAQASAGHAAQQRGTSVFTWGHGGHGRLGLGQAKARRVGTGESVAWVGSPGLRCSQVRGTARLVRRIAMATLRRDRKGSPTPRGRPAAGSAVQAVRRKPTPSRFFDLAAALANIQMPEDFGPQKPPGRPRARRPTAPVPVAWWICRGGWEGWDENFCRRQRATEGHGGPWRAIEGLEIGK
eukprot:Skav232139  [mRNA]  locus=scaffold1744:224234:229757:- [translate_table: standard]